MESHSTTTRRVPKSKADDLPKARQTLLPLNIVVVGAGIGGLAAACCLGKTGHHVTILESASVIGEIGAGIQLGPNITRLLFRWGLREELEKVVVAPQVFKFLRYENGETIGQANIGEAMIREYGFPYYHIHRADLHSILLNHARLHATVRLDSRVTNVNPSMPSLTLHTGEVVSADLIIGADGIHSMLRNVVVGEQIIPTSTGDATYRATIPTSLMADDPDLKPFIDTPGMTCWMGPNKHIMAYCIRAQKEFNLVMIHPDEGSTESWTSEASTEKMRQDFVGWEPRVQKLLSLVKKTMNWKLMDRAPLSTWIHTEGKIALLGDACHPMLPYRAQGAAMAIEDAATLGVLLSHIAHKQQLGPMLHAYQRLRYKRASATQADSRLNQKTFHYADGPEQEKRDTLMRTSLALVIAASEASHGDDEAANLNIRAGRSKGVSQYGFDAELTAEEWWNLVGEHEIGGTVEVSRM